MDFIKKYKKEIYKVIYLVCFIVFLVSLRKLIMKFMDPVTLKSFWDFAFITEKNKLNWAALGALGVFISYWVTVKENAKKIDADLVAGARIKWIQEVRKQSTLIISDLKEIQRIEVSENYTKKELTQFYNELDRIEADLYELLLFFGDDSERDKGTIYFLNIRIPKREDNNGANILIISLIECILKHVRKKRSIQESINYKYKKRCKEKKFVDSINTGWENSEQKMSFEDYLLYSSNISLRRFEHYQKNIKRRKKEISEQKIMNIQLDLRFYDLRIDFTNILREYLKLEWKNVSINKK